MFRMNMIRNMIPQGNNNFRKVSFEQKGIFFIAIKIHFHSFQIESLRHDWLHSIRVFYYSRNDDHPFSYAFLVRPRYTAIIKY